MTLLSMKMGLFSSYSAGHQKAVDYHTRLVLHAIGNTIKGVLKPRNVSSNDKVKSCSELRYILGHTTSLKLCTWPYH